ncbi:MAG: SpoIIE family protein phosphatase [Leptospiraceae bacterium]|nr:SpoIIE family protein phosphatase [Leptospiraceae bacterium]MDW7975747.1 SpoIIE family protein phosphatase [Leptospiraceae bacterium]
MRIKKWRKSFAFKISLFYSFFSFILGFFALWLLFYFAEKKILQSLQKKILNIGLTGLQFFQENHYKAITKYQKIIEERIIDYEKQNKLNFPKDWNTFEIISLEEHEKLYQENDYQSVIQILRKIKAGSSETIILKDFYEQKFYDDTSKPFITFVYILNALPNQKDYNLVYFSFNTDMEELDNNNDGVISNDEELLKIGTIWNISELINIQRTFQTQKPVCDEKFYQDEWGVWLSCFIPIFDYKEQFYGVMGLDLDVRSDYNTLNKLKNLFFILSALLSIIIGITSFLIAKYITKPIVRLTEASLEIANRNFQIKELPVTTDDEIGILTKNFNFMVHEIREYSQNLEGLVQKRTKELQDSLETIKKLKIQQDGDYFLTSLLLQPLLKNWNKSQNITTEVLIKQKKEFDFKNKTHQIGGDFAITGNLRFLNEDKSIDKWIFFFIGDAMGKSLQGAGGVLTAGSIINAYIARSAEKNRILSQKPKQWLLDLSFELHSVFLKFEGSMMISAATGLINENSGELIYLNFEFPKTAVYRNNTTMFLEESLDFLNFKLGSPLQMDFRILHTFLQNQDILIVGSDGRDDILLKETQRKNEDDDLFLEIVNRAQGDLQRIYEEITKIAELTDDICLLKITYTNKRIKSNFENYKELFHNKKYEELISLYKKTKEINHIMDYYYLSYSYFKLNKYKEAIEWILPIKNYIKKEKIKKYIEILNKQNNKK